MWVSLSLDYPQKTICRRTNIGTDQTVPCDSLKTERNVRAERVNFLNISFSFGYVFPICALRLASPSLNLWPMDTFLKISHQSYSTQSTTSPKFPRRHFPAPPSHLSKCQSCTYNIICAVHIQEKNGLGPLSNTSSRCQYPMHNSFARNRILCTFCMNVPKVSHQTNFVGDSFF